MRTRSSALRPLPVGVSLVSLASLVVLVLILIAALAAAPVRAQEEGWSDSFDDPSLSAWDHSPDVIVADGVLRISPDNFAARPGSWDSYVLDVRLRYSGDGEVLIFYQLTDQGRYILHLHQGEVWLERGVEGGGAALGHAPTEGVRPDEWLDLQVSVNGAQHSVSLNGAQVLTAEDTDPLPPGGIGFHTVGGASAELDQVALQPVRTEMQTGPVGAEGEGEGAAPAATPVASDESAGQDGSGSGGLLGQFFASQADPIELRTFLINLVLAALLSYVLSLVYTYWGAALSNRRRFAANFILVAITTTFIISVVRSSVALSLGLVGALSITRFRTAIKDPEELAYLFFAIGIGIGLGDNQRMITVLAMLVGIVLVGFMRFLHRPHADTNLNLTVGTHNPHKVELDDIMAALAPHCAKLRLVRIDETETAMESAFAVEFRNLAQVKAARAALRKLSPSLEVSFLDSAGVM